MPRTLTARIAVLIAIVGLFGAATVACTPEEVALFRANYHPAPTSCHAAVDQFWPASSRAWAHRIVNRESGGVAAAANRHSSARGCFQLLVPMHADLFTAVGCHWTQWANASCNVRAALKLYQGSGSAPWRL